MEINILIDIAIIFGLATGVNFLFQYIKVPSAVGYLITGVVAGPYMLSLINSTHNIETMAEIGVILLLFTIGMEFSLKHLLKIRKIVFLGGFMQVVLTAVVFFISSRYYGLDVKASVFIAFISSLSSSALVLKILQERSELTSNYGRTVLGILIFQDLMLVPLLLFTNLLGNPQTNVTYQIILLIIKSVLILAFVYAGNKWIFPKILHIIAMRKSQELFMMLMFLICIGIAIFTSWMGMSLAFGAFLAGIMISDSQYSHNAFGDLIPFKDIFTSFFFVSIGMMLDVSFVYNNPSIVIFSVLLILMVKSLISGTTGFLLGHTLKGTVMVGLALSQVGEFSFILAKLGYGYKIISDYFYQLFLASAVITMALTPFLIKFSLPIAEALTKLPLPSFLLKGLFPLPEVEIPKKENHIVIIGKDSSALKLSAMVSSYKIPHISIIFDPALVHDKMKKGEPVIYGDSTNIPILQKAYIHTAEIAVVSVGNLIATMSIIEKIRMINKNIYIIARSKYIKDVETLYNIGANQVLPEKLEIAIDMFSRLLMQKLYPQKNINRIMTEIRAMKLGEMFEKDLKNQPSIIDELPDASISAHTIESGAFAINKTLSEIELRKTTGVTLLAVKKKNGMIENPSISTLFEDGDVIYLLGSVNQIYMALKLFNNAVDLQ